MQGKIPNVVKCDQCGRLSAVERWDIVYEALLPSDTVYTPPRVKEINCMIDCSKCGNRVQVMPPPK